MVHLFWEALSQDICGQALTIQVARAFVPDSSSFWSTIKPGGSVAISNRIPPGSLKYTE